jgi:hypothetical protein
MILDLFRKEIGILRENIEIKSQQYASENCVRQV